MISVTSVTDKYILQPTLLSKHRRTLEWLSATVLWKQEFTFFQKLLDQYAAKFTAPEDKKQIEHFQNIIFYYNGEVIHSLASRLRAHEKSLAAMLENRDESRTEYFKEHDGLMGELESLNRQVIEYKGSFYAFIEKVM